MCTAITYKTKDHYFGRNLDLEYSYNETVTVTPRNFRLNFKHRKSINNHYSMIGMAYVCENYPLYYDATNEKGLSMAGLNFPDYAHYYDIDMSKDNIAPFEFLPWILCNCATVDEAKNLLQATNLVMTDFSNELKATPLHWIISDENTSIAVEPLKDSLRIYDNPVGVLTNSPPFDFQIQNLASYMNISTTPATNRFSYKITLTPHSRGSGSFGLPGDLSSPSRFVRAAFAKLNSVSETTENESISQFFHILDSVSQIRGCNDVGNSVFEYTQYSSCCNTTKGIYYYITYNNRSITAHNMHNTDLNSDKLTLYPLITEQDIKTGC